MMELQMLEQEDDVSLPFFEMKRIVQKLNEAGCQVGNLFSKHKPELVASLFRFDDDQKAESKQKEDEFEHFVRASIFLEKKSRQHVMNWRG
jgi:hypothetical protein